MMQHSHLETCTPLDCPDFQADRGESIPLFPAKCRACQGEGTVTIGPYDPVFGEDLEPCERCDGTGIDPTFTAEDE